MATQDEWKAEFERERLLEFAAAARLPVVPGSVQSRPPREPDILCQLEDRGLVAFELVHLADEDLMHTFARAERDRPEATWFGDPTLCLIGEKLLKKTTRPPIRWSYSPTAATPCSPTASGRRATRKS